MTDNRGNTFRADLYVQDGTLWYPPGDGFITADSNVTTSSTCDLGLSNWNDVPAYGVSKEGGSDAKAPLKLSDQGCIEGFARSIDGNFDELRLFTCQYNYVRPSRGSRPLCLSFLLPD
jgi:hypothetical protein